MAPRTRSKFEQSPPRDTTPEQLLLNEESFAGIVFLAIDQIVVLAY